MTLDDIEPTSRIARAILHFGGVVEALTGMTAPETEKLADMLERAAELAGDGMTFQPEELASHKMAADYVRGVTKLRDDYWARIDREKAQAETEAAANG